MNLIIIGAGGHGSVVKDIAVLNEKYDEILFLDDSDNTLNLTMGKTNTYEKYIDNSEFFVAIGNNLIREKKQNMLIDNGARIATLIHPKSIIAKNIAIGQGTVVMAGAILNPCVNIGDGVIINTSSSVDHESIIGSFTHIAVGTHIAGAVKIDEKVFVGAGVTIINNINICSDCTIGAGAVVVKDIEEVGTYIGVPAKNNGA